VIFDFHLRLAILDFRFSFAIGDFAIFNWNLKFAMRNNAEFEI